MKLLLSFIALSLLGCGADSSKSSAVAAKDVVTGPFSVTYDQFGGPPRILPDGERCGEIHRFTINESHCNLIAFCGGANVTQVYYEKSLATENFLLSPVIDALSDASLRGERDVGQNYSVADDTGFTIDANTTVKNFTARGYLSSELIDPSLAALISALDAASSETFKSGQ